MNTPSINLNQVAGLLHDPNFRGKLLQDPGANASKLGYVKDDNVSYKVCENTADTFYCVMPQYQNDGHLLSMADLGNINAAGALSVSTAGSIGSLCTTASTAGSAGTALVINGKTY